MPADSSWAYLKLPGPFPSQGLAPSAEKLRRTQRSASSLEKEKKQDEFERLVQCLAESMSAAVLPHTQKPSSPWVGKSEK